MKTLLGWELVTCAERNRHRWGGASRKHGPAIKSLSRLAHALWAAAVPHIEVNIIFLHSKFSTFAENPLPDGLVFVLVQLKRVIMFYLWLATVDLIKV